MNQLKNVFFWLFKFLRSHKKTSILLLIILFGIGYFIFRPKNVNGILTEEATRGDIIKSVSATGKIAAESQANLTFQTPGKLVYLGAKVGDNVIAGQTIASLDQSTVEKNIKSALLTYSQERNTFEQTLDNYNVNSIAEAPNETIKRILENNQFDLDKSVNSVELQDLVRQNSFLTTPISGVLTRSDATTTGVNVGITTTFTVVDPSSLTFTMDIDEADIGNVNEGQTVNITLDSFPDENLKLSVDSIDLVSHTTTSGGNAFSVKAKLTALDKYRIGMAGNAEIVVDRKDNVIVVSSSSISDGFVYVKSNKKFVKRKVITGMQNDTQVEIKSGLVQGEIVATDPNSLPKSLIAN